MSLERLGPYKIEKQLGQGGMGTVYAVVHEQTGQPAAVKVLSQLMSERGNYRVRFDVEIETLKKLKHAHIVQLYGYGEHDGHLFYAMEMVSGRSLQEELRAGRVFSWREVARYGQQACAALKHAHDSGVIHRDLKPANLLLTDDDRIKLADFGIAKLFGASHLTADGAVVGTADYMAPEQAEGRAVSHRCDLYSLGSVLYALLARRPPFTGKSIAQVVHSLNFDAPVPVRRLAPDVPPALEELISELLNKDPQQRPPTALVVANRLKSIEIQLDPVMTGDGDYQLAGDAKSHVTRDLGATRAVPDTGDSVASPVPGTDATLIAARGVPRPSQTRVIAAGSTSSSGASSLSRFTTISEAELRREVYQQEGAGGGFPEWLKLTAIAVLFLAVAVGVWFATRPPSADGLYRQIRAAAAAGDAQQLKDVENQIAEFLKRYGDDGRATEIQVYRNEIEADRRARRFERPTRRMRDDAQLSPLDRAYLEASQLIASDPDRALEKLRAISILFAEDPSLEDSAARKTLDLVESEIARLESLQKTQSESHAAMLRHRLARVRDQFATEPEEARRACQALITLYSAKPWAQEIVGEARRLLDAPPPPTQDAAETGP